MSFWDLLRDAVDTVGGLWRGRLEVLEDNAERCLIQGDCCQVSLDLRQRVAEVGAGLRLPFAQFSAVRICRIDDDGGDSTWTVSLATNHRGSFAVGRSQDDVSASIVAARLSRHLGCPVQS